MRKLILSAAILLTGFALSAQDVTGWRGFRNAMYPDATPPTQWGTETNVKWTTPIDKPTEAWGNASPIVVGDRIFVTSEKSNILCFSLKDGKLLWDASQDYPDVGAEVPEKIPPTHPDNGYVSPTIASDGKQVYFLTGLGTFGAYTLDGKRVWGRALPRPGHGWGHSASPIFVGNNVVVHVGGHLMTLDKATGDTLLDVAAGEGSWGTPVVLKAGEKTIIVTAGGAWYNAADGEPIAGGVQPFPWGSPVAVDNVVYHFDEHDTDGASAYTVNDDGTPKKLWVTKIPKERHYASPIVYEGLVYALSANGRLLVLDITDGTIIYEKKLDFGDKMTAYPSPFFANGLIYLSGDSGVTFVIKPGREYEEVARNEFTPFRATPVPVGKKLIIRTKEDLSCLEVAE